MRVIHTRVYNGCNIFINPRPAPDGKFYSTFSIHRQSPGTPPTQTALIHTEGWSDSFVFGTEEEAIENAEKRARDWINANPA